MAYYMPSDDVYRVTSADREIRENFMPVSSTSGKIAMIAIALGRCSDFAMKLLYRENGQNHIVLRFGVELHKPTVRGRLAPRPSTGQRLTTQAIVS